MSVESASYLIACRHPGNETGFMISFAKADGLRPLVDIEMSPYAVTRPVVVVQTASPERLSTNTVESRPGYTLWEQQSRKRDVPFKYKRIASAFPGGWAAEVESSRDVSGSVEVLCPGVKKKQLVGPEGRGITSFGLIVNDRPVGTVASDGCERGASVQLHLRAKLLYEILELVGGKPPKSILYSYLSLQ